MLRVTIPIFVQTRPQICRYLALAALLCSCGGTDESALRQGETQRPTPEVHADPVAGPANADDEERDRTLAAESDSASLSRAEIRVLVIGEFPDDLVQASADRLREVFDAHVVVDAPVELPEEAYYPPRRRYRADRLLDYLRQVYRGSPSTTRVVALTSVDISTTNPPHQDWGVFGLGDMSGRACVVSSFRLRRRARDAEHLSFRVTTTVVHEIGHTMGLPHCTESRCVMRDAEGSIRTVDTSTGDLGPTCQASMEQMNPRRVSAR